MMKEEKEDYFEQIPEDKPAKPKEPKAPALKPDDPLYYEQEDTNWEHLTPSPYHRGRMIWAGCAILLIVALFSFLYIFFFTPVVDQAEIVGYVENVQREGTVFKTYEGRMLPYESLMDTLRPYENDFVFSTKDEHLASKLLRSHAAGNAVKVQYEVYRQRMPWRGNSKTVIVAVDSVANPSRLLPPGRRPEFVNN